ncbi:hypothetical protein RAS1_33380 [Phycisphaerae bacterium RAS1]|nr:hypothetical protein RAS1_33380 [Phycisphaerae bacterium RAS1]
MSDSFDPQDEIASEDARIDEALRLAYRDMLRAHRLAGQPVVVMDSGVIKEVPAEEIERELDAAASSVQADTSPPAEEIRDEH